MTSAEDSHTLFSLGSSKEALHWLQALEARRPLLTSEQVNLAGLLLLNGDCDTALAISQRLIKQRDLSAKERCRLRGTLGLCYFRKGDSSKGTDEFRSGIEFAQHSNEPLEECALRVHLLQSQLHWLGPQHADAGLSALRRKVHQVADPTIALNFQLSLAELAGKLGFLPRARKHLETARALLPKVTNRAVHSSFKQIEVAVSVAAGDFAEALRLGLDFASDADSDWARSNLPTLLGHIYIIQANFDEAEHWLQRGFEIMNRGGGSEIALRDTLMWLKLCQGRLDEVASMDAAIRQLLERTDAGDSFQGLWYLLTRIKWLYRARQVSGGLDVAIGAIPRVQRMADRTLLARMKLLAAEGYGLDGQPQRGSSIVAEVFDENPNPPLELTAEAFRVIGSLLAADNPDAAREYSHRAKQIFGEIGNIAAVIEIEKDAEDRIRANDRMASKEPVARHEVSDRRPAAAALTEQIAALVEVGVQPRLLGAQTLSLVADSESTIEARLVAIHDDGRNELLATHSSPGAVATDDQAAMCIDLGTDRQRRYEIRAVPRPTAAARTTLVSIQGIVRAALTLARASQLEREQATLWPEQTPEQQLGLICASERMLDLVETIRRVAGANVTVLLTGETGVGKELFARALHQASTRVDRTFLPFNCSTVPRDMFDSQLFGHKRGSFTGAQNDAAGIIRSAANGTLFLDEIGDMPIEVQPKLLRFLESGEILPLGEGKPQLVDVRIVAATNANLDQLVAEGRFREDLYYRLNVIRINIPPLRERREEVPALVEHFLERFGRELHKPLLRVADETMEYLVLYRWPGNVRQLANEIRRMVALAEPGAVLMPAHLSDDIAASRRTIPADAQPRQATEVITRIDQPLAAAVEHVERAAIQRALAASGGSLDEAARMLGLSRKGLYLKRQRLSLH